MASSLHLWSPAKVPGPLAVGQALASAIANATLFSAVGSSLELMLVGFTCSALIGIPLGVCVGQVRWVRTALGAALMGLQTLPSVCWLPLAVLWFGTSLQAILFVVLGNTVFSIATATMGAIAQVPPLLVQAGATLGARGWTLVMRVTIPAALPGIVTGLRTGWTFAWRALMAAELICPQAGLGRLLQRGRDHGDIAEILATMLVIIIIGLLVEAAVFANVERRLRRRWGLPQA